MYCVLCLLFVVCCLLLDSAGNLSLEKVRAAAARFVEILEPREFLPKRRRKLGMLWWTLGVCACILTHPQKPPNTYNHPHTTLLLGALITLMGPNDTTPGTSWVSPAPGASRGLLGPPVASWDPRGPAVASWGLLRPPVPPETSWGPLGPPGASWCLLAPPPGPRARDGLYRRRCCDPCWWEGSHFPCSRGPSYHLTKTRLMWTEPPDAPRSAKNKVKAEPHSSGRNLCRQYKDAKLRGDCAREPAFAPWWACFPSTVLLPRSPCFKPFHPQARERPA